MLQNETEVTPEENQKELIRQEILKRTKTFILANVGFVLILTMSILTLFFSLIRPNVISNGVIVALVIIINVGSVIIMHVFDMAVLSQIKMPSLDTQVAHMGILNRNFLRNKLTETLIGVKIPKVPIDSFGTEK